MHIHEYLNSNAQGFIQQTEQHLGEIAAQAAQAGANSILTEQELGNSFDKGLERIWKIHEGNRKHQILATIAANIQFNNDVAQTIENWFKTNYNQPHASFDSSQQATDAFFQAIRTIN